MGYSLVGYSLLSVLTLCSGGPVRRPGGRRRVPRLALVADLGHVAGVAADREGDALHAAVRQRHEVAALRGGAVPRLALAEVDAAGVVLHLIVVAVLGRRVAVLLPRVLLGSRQRDSHQSRENDDLGQDELDQVTSHRRQVATEQIGTTHGSLQNRMAFVSVISCFGSVLSEAV